MKAWSPEFEKHLLSVKSYREFLGAFFLKKASWDQPKALTFQEFSMRAGLASRSFLKDVIVGRKRLTPASFQKTILGLGLNKIWTEYLEALIGIEETMFQNRVLDQKYFSKKLQVLKKRLRLRKASQSVRTGSQIVEAFLDENFPEVYAALGTVENGNSLKQITRKVRLPEGQVKIILSRMAEVGLVVQQNDIYFPQVEALNVEELKTSYVFQRDFFRSLEKVKRRFQTQVSSDESLFLTQTFSVASKDLKRFKESLAHVIDDFVADSETPEGDTIAELTLGFTKVE